MHNKILVSTVDCWNSKMGSNTMESFLSNYPRELIANVFIRAGRPDSLVCDNFLQIVENKVISSIYQKNTKTCLRMRSTSLSNSSESVLDNENNIERKRYRFFRRYRFWIFLYIREILWWMGNWKCNDLNDFIDEFNPDILFFPIEGYIHFNRLNEYLIKKTGKRAIAVVWDDVFTYKTSYNPLSLIYRYLCRKSIQRLLKSCEKVYCLNPKLKKEFELHFNIVTTIIHKPIDYSNTVSDFSTPNERLKFVYAGNLLIDRDKTIISLIKSINKVNKESTKIELDIFPTSEVSRKLRRTLSISKHCNVHNPVSNNELTEILKRYDVLLFVEALKGRYKNAARLSFSTKFADYLKLSRCILAIGSKNIAPIEYLEEHNAACIITDEKQIYDTLQTLISNKNLLNDYALASFQTGFYNHNKEKVQRELYNQFDSFL